jgi:hypothetical protein
VKNLSSKLSILALATLTLPFSGCVPLSVGAVAGTGAGYYLRGNIEEEKRKEVMQAADKVKRENETELKRLRGSDIDRRMQQDISTRMLSGGLTQVFSVQASVTNGRAVLSGTVPSRRVADRAVQIAQQTPGVKEVISNLYVVESEITPIGETQPIPHTALLKQPMIQKYTFERGEKPQLEQAAPVTAPRNIPDQQMRAPQQPQQQMQIPMQYQQAAPQIPPGQQYNAANRFQPPAAQPQMGQNYPYQKNSNQQQMSREQIQRRYQQMQMQGRQLAYPQAAQQPATQQQNPFFYGGQK